ncbi:uncharacterized protein LOC143026864 [Oratosquilla oratoria]|uniref:uncharacterized protein LOC143026864 n=1 Tax=Oratosquilla oratoria TaxID=337810 RepID=UPI003F7607E7
MTLIDNTNSDRPERQTAIISRELHRFNFDIVALSETRRAGEGQLREEGGQYTFFWKGYDPDYQRIHGVGFAIRNTILSKLTEQLIGMSARLMTVRIQLVKSQQATIISAYAPTLDAEDLVKEEFYSQLDNILSAVPKDDKIIFLGDFNARVGRDRELWTGTIGKEGVGKVNANGTLLLTKCAEHNLQDVLLTRAVTGADECWTDHRLIASTMKIKLRPKVKHHSKENRAKKFNIDALQDPRTRVAFQQRLLVNLQNKTPDHLVEENWNQLKEAIITTCEETIGRKKRKHQDCFNDNNETLKELIDQKRKAHIILQNEPKSAIKRELFKKCKSAVQRTTRTLKNQWWREKSREI